MCPGNSKGYKHFESSFPFSCLRWSGPSELQPWASTGPGGGARVGARPPPGKSNNFISQYEGGFFAAFSTCVDLNPIRSGGGGGFKSPPPPPPIFCSYAFNIGAAFL